MPRWPPPSLLQLRIILAAAADERACAGAHACVCTATSRLVTVALLFLLLLFRLSTPVCSNGGSSFVVRKSCKVCKETTPSARRKQIPYPSGSAAVTSGVFVN